MIDTRLAFPQRSPYPLIVPWTMRAPCVDGGEAVRDRALRVVVGVDAERRAGRASRITSAQRAGSVAPLVSHGVIHAAPPASAARRQSRA